MNILVSHRFKQTISYFNKVAKFIIENLAVINIYVLL